MTEHERHAPSTPPEQAGPRIIATFFVEFIPSVSNEYELLEKASGGPLKISLPELQMEVLIFGLHCLDRAVFAHCGAEYRDAFMDHAFGTACEAFATALPDHAREQFLGYFDELCQTRQREYGKMKLFPVDNVAFKDVLSWEFGKRICIDAGVENPVALKAMFDEAIAIFKMMNKIAQTL